jgi:hypothetical protein
MRVLAVAALFLLPAATIATDPPDVGGKLDVRSLKATRDGAHLQLTIRTYGPWASKLLQTAGGGHSGPRPGINALTVYYDVDGNGAADFTGRVIYRRGGLYAWITGRGKAFEPVPVKRPTSSSASFTQPVDVLFPAGTPAPKTLRLTVVSLYRKRDRAPNRGWLTVVFGPR